jgi:phage baseplate assembly protein W
MAEGLGVKIPLFVDSIDGAYGLSKDMEELAQQNLKTIILTSPGERVMIPDFGVGVRNYLFEQNTPGTQIALQNAIQQQVTKYAPYISIENLQVSSPNVIGALPNEKDQNIINIHIRFRVPGANITSNLTIPVEI